jgi:phytoene/squalene synthetase
MSPSIQYASLLIRLWREVTAETQDLSADWHSEVEHIQTGERWAFGTLDELLEFLRSEAEDVLVLGSTLNQVQG